jgi:hypothetical protein
VLITDLRNACLIGMSKEVIERLDNGAVWDNEVFVTAAIENEPTVVVATACDL